MAFTIDGLRAEIANNPKGLASGGVSLTDLAAAGMDRDGDCAALLNALTGAGAELVSLPSIPKGDFLLGIAPAALVLASKDSSTQAKWDRVINLIVGAPDTVSVGSATIQAVLGIALADGILSQGQIDALSKRTGSRAEVLWGPGTVITDGCIGRARNGE